MDKTNTQAFYLEARKSLGQNFLTDAPTIQKILDSILLNSNSENSLYVHEIGPGSGAITKPMLDNNVSVLALEKDKRALLGLQKTLGQNYGSKLKLLETDILKFNPEEYLKTHPESQLPLCFGNIPYYITSDILLWFCQFKKQYRQGIFMMQNEVADRLQATHSTKSYGRLSVKMQLNFDVKKLFVVPSSCFVPKPKVNSAIVQLTPNNFSFPSPEKEKEFEVFCATLFSSRRKMIRKIFQVYLQQLNDLKKQEFWDKLGGVNIFEDTRPDAINPKSILALFEIQKSILQSKDL